jgi:hypothetical protein
LAYQPRDPLWGATRIHGELLKLGIEIAHSTVAKYMIRRRGPQGWKTCLRNHPPHIAGIDRFVVPTIAIRLFYGLAIVRLERRVGIRDRPTASRSPWQNGHIDRLFGSFRRQCLDYVVVFTEAHLRQILRAYADYCNRVRTHLTLEKDAPFWPSRPDDWIGRPSPSSVDFIIDMPGCLKRQE